LQIQRALSTYQISQKLVAQKAKRFVDFSVKVPVCVVCFFCARDDWPVAIFFTPTFPGVFVEWLSDWARPWSDFSALAGQMPLSLLLGPNFAR
jgi:hypothetical protein